MKNTERKMKILQVIIDDFINTAHPVGSRTIAKKYPLGISSATIRNEMADLEELGYLLQPHTSSGRIPSDRGYRLYVDSILNRDIIIAKEKRNIIRELLLNKVIEIDIYLTRTKDPCGLFFFAFIHNSVLFLKNQILNVTLK